MIGLAAVALLSGVADLEIRGVHPLGPRAGRWYPLVASRVEGGAVTFDTDSGSVRWTGTIGPDSRVEGAILPRQGDAAAHARVGAAPGASLTLPPPPAGPVALGIGLSEAERGSLAAGGWIVSLLDPSRPSELEPFRLDLADLVVFGDRSPALGEGAVSAVERCLGAGIPVAVAEEAALALFAGRPPRGLRPIAEPARGKDPPLRVREGASPPRRVAFCGLEGSLGALLLGPIALVLLGPLLRGRAGGRSASIAALLGGAALTLLAGTIPLPASSEIRLAILDPASGASRLERILLDGGTTAFRLETGEAVWPGGESDRLDVERTAGGTSFRVRGAARVAGVGPSPVRVTHLDGERGTFSLDPIGPGCVLREGRIVGAVPPLGRGDRIPPAVEREGSRPSRRLRALLDLIEPPPGEVFLAEIAAPGGPATFLLARSSGD
ncbi:MAG: hypothetical protein L0323_16865 [Planctomycetes bacterium]|nr:hypothetical protein [Planctomycetota bacterium]